MLYHVSVKPCLACRQHHIKLPYMCNQPAVCSAKQGVLYAGQENKDAGLALTDKQTAKLYSLQRQAAGVRSSHDTFSEAFAAYAVQMDDFRLSPHQPSPQVCHLQNTFATGSTVHCDMSCDTAL